MANTVNINLVYNATSKSTEAFAALLRDDLAYCFKRFKISAELSTNNNSENQSGVNLIVVASADLNNTSFLDSVNHTLSQNAKSYVVSLEPLRTGISPTLFRAHSYNFWDKVVETGETRYFVKTDNSTQHLYWERLIDIVSEIMEHQSGKPKLGAIYLAQTHESQNQDRDNIKRDLLDLGYSIVPENPISNNYEESVQEINDAINKSTLIIHPIPSVYSAYFVNKEISLVEHQCNLSAKFITNGSNKKINRVIWIPSEYDVIDEKNQIFLERIQRDFDLSSNTLVLKVNLEDLKKIYRKLLSGESSIVQERETLPDLYVIADKQNDSISNIIDKEANSAGLKFGINFHGITYNEHLRYLANAQVVVVNYTLENQQWINVKVHDILKSPGLETSKPNKKLVLVKSSKDLDTSFFEDYFNEVRVVEADEIKLNIL